MIDPTFSDFKKQQINKYSTEVKAKMKELVADAKGRLLAVSNRSQGYHPKRTRRGDVWLRGVPTTSGIAAAHQREDRPQRDHARAAQTQGHRRHPLHGVRAPGDVRQPGRYACVHCSIDDLFVGVTR